MPGAILVIRICKWTGGGQRMGRELAKGSIKMCQPNHAGEGLSHFFTFISFLINLTLINNYYKTIVILLYGNYFSLNKQ